MFTILDIACITVVKHCKTGMCVAVPVGVTLPAVEGNGILDIFAALCYI